MNTDRHHTLTIGIDYAEIAKEISAQLAIATAGHPDAPQPGNCRLKELTVLKAKNACIWLSTALAGYTTEFNVTNGNMATIELALPVAMKSSTQRLIALHAKDVIAQTVISDFLTSIPQFAPELRLSTSIRNKALSSLRQLLAPR